ncbi:thermonuclease family protein [Ideonella benzenivorans]|uniref:thermonuclease family protein n=1 Tax=Ideonella benzenivorans TaxID=2831643 RepID=UPI001CED83A9|nr:thermonuclease family protein [Ideonella benzenivorans]
MKTANLQRRVCAEQHDAPVQFHRLVALILLLVAVCTPTWADAVLQGRVISVQGGGALTLVDAQQREHRIRLAYIEAPELTETFGAEAQTALAALVLNREVKIQVLETTADGSELAEVVSPNDKNVNLELLGRGLAWHAYFDRQSAAQRERYQTALLEAQRERRGMWALDRLETPRELAARREQLLRWWLYAIAVCAAFLLIAEIGSVNGHRIDAWLAGQEAQSEASAEGYRNARITEEAAAAERDHTREVADHEMDRLAAERRQRMQSAGNPTPKD